MQLTNFHAKYFAFELTKRVSSDSMEKLASTLVDAQVDLNPHQVEAALFAFRSPLSNGAILADEVGLGKTIEAGLVIAQKWAERKRKILIITPANLRKQWSQELQEKFFLPSIILETKTFNDAIKARDLNPFKQDEIVLCSYQFVKTKQPYVELVDWDLVVIDEAHRLRNVYKTGNKIARAIRDAVVKAPKILLTATPLQNSLLELYGLVSIIDEYTFGDLKSFKAQYSRISGQSDEAVFNELKERLKPICKRTLRRQVLEYIRYTNRIALVEEFYPSSEEQQLYDLVTEYLQRENLYALPASQRKLMTLILRRLLASSTYAISSTLEGLAKKLETIISKKEGDDFEEGIAENFETYDELKDEWDEDENVLAEPSYSDYDYQQIKLEIESLKTFEKLAKSIRLNSKGEKLFTGLAKGFDELERLGAEKKAIIFTESTRTQLYLFNILEARGYGGKVVLFNGTNTDPQSRKIYNEWHKRFADSDKVTGSKTADMRAALVDKFREDATIMIATEAAAEGINLQFCSLIINYDLPWNPQRIEQRIGRCHRYGQKFDVVVMNFLNKANAADERVYELLKEKFELFNGVFGASDQVLGGIENGIDFERRIARIYQECRTTEEIDAEFKRLGDELEEIKREKFKDTNNILLENFDQSVLEKIKLDTDNYLGAYELWLWNITRFYLQENAEYKDSEYAFTLRRNPFPKLGIHAGPYKIGKNIEDANVYRIHHPLAQEIIKTCKASSLETKHLNFQYSGQSKKISILEPLKGSSGWLLCQHLEISTFEVEDHILLSGVDNEGNPLEEEQCKRLFTLEAIEGFAAEPTRFLNEALTNNITLRRNEILERVGLRNAHYFEIELEKLDHWGEDRRNSLKVTLKELDDQIKEIKKQGRLAPNLPEKLKLEKERKRLESERDEAWREYDGAAKEIERSKDKLIDTIEQRLAQQVKMGDLFLVSWELT